VDTALNIQNALNAQAMLGAGTVTVASAGLNSLKWDITFRGIDVAQLEVATDPTDATGVVATTQAFALSQKVVQKFQIDAGATGTFTLSYGGIESGVITFDGATPANMVTPITTKLEALKKNLVSSPLLKDVTVTATAKGDVVEFAVTFVDPAGPVISALSVNAAGLKKTGAATA